MDVLIVIEDHHAAVLVLCRNIDALFEHQIIQQTRTDLSEISGKNRVIIVDVRIRRAKVAIDGVRRGR